MEAGNALEPVVVRAMERAGWKVDAADPQDPRQVAVRIGPNLLVTGHPDGAVRMPIERGEAAAPQLFLFEGETHGPAYGDPMVVEIKTRGPEAFKRWQTLGAERSHPASVAQAAFLLARRVRRPAGRGDRHDGHGGSHLGLGAVFPPHGWRGPCGTPASGSVSCAAHHVRSGPDPDALPERDFSATSWQCRSCPFLAVCLPGAAEVERRDGD